MQTIPVFKPLIQEAEIRASTEALEMGWLGMGAYVGEFEQALQRIIETTKSGSDRPACLRCERKALRLPTTSAKRSSACSAR